MLFLTYEEQAIANKKSLVNYPEFNSRYKALKDISTEFETAHIRYALCCSASLFLQGITDDFHDLDIIIDMRDTEKVCSIIEKIGGNLLETTQKSAFKSPFYQEAKYGDIHIDLIGDFTIATFDTQYRYIVSENEIIPCYIGHDITVHASPIEANMLLYGMMVGWEARRQYKTKLCYEFLQKTGVKYPEIIRRDLATLPDNLKQLCKLLSPINFRKAPNR